MDSRTTQPSQENESLGEDVMESLGDTSQSDEAGASPEENEGNSEGNQGSNDPLFVQKRLKQQKRAHEREVRELHARMAEMQSRMPMSQPTTNADQYSAQQPMTVGEQVHKAVREALNQREMDERKAREMQNQALVQKQYNGLYKHLDTMADKYEDFHDIVLGDDTQYTPAMRDYALTLPKSGPGSAGEVLYKLGKNKDELNRIGTLHPLEQASEMAKLSHALISGGDSKNSQSRPLGQIKTNPITTSTAVTEKTPIGNIRQRMKKGTWK